VLVRALMRDSRAAGEVVEIEVDRPTAGGVAKTGKLVRGAQGVLRERLDVACADCVVGAPLNRR